MSDESVDLHLDELKELIRVLRENDITEFELRRAEYRLRICHGGGSVRKVASEPEVSVPENGGQPSIPVEDETMGDARKSIEQEKLHEIRSPIVGTFYRSSSPGSAPFVESGDPIRRNQVLCIIEAMKIMNEIESDLDGEIAEIHVSNGQPVEFGELLFSIRPRP